MYFPSQVTTLQKISTEKSCLSPSRLSSSSSPFLTVAHHSPPPPFVAGRHFPLLRSSLSPRRPSPVASLPPAVAAPPPVAARITSAAYRRRSSARLVGRPPSMWHMDPSINPCFEPSVDPTFDPSVDTTTQGGSDGTARNPESKTRGVTQMKKVILERASSGKGRTVIEFDGKNPMGLDRQKFLSYVAYLGRSKVSILFNNWKDVPQQTLELIWQDLLTVYDIPCTPQWRTYWLRYAGNRWRDFKSKLSARFIYGPKQGESPCQHYPYIDQDTWEKFVAIRQDPTFEAIRTQHQEIQSKNVHPHRLSRGGYYTLEKKMMEEKLKERQEASISDPSYVFTPPSPPRRHEKWKKARMDKMGNFISDESRLVAERIDSLELQSSEGVFIESGRIDILAAALEKEEHSGRVRGMGRGFGVKDVFGSTARRHGGLSMQQVQQMINEAAKKKDEHVQQMIDDALTRQKNELTASFKTTMKEMFAQFKMNIPIPQTALSRQVDDMLVEVSPPSHSEKASSPDPFANIPDLGAQGLLYLEDPIRRVVAFGSIYKSGGTLHGKQLLDSQVKVSIQKIVDPQAYVPFPAEDVEIVGAALQHFIAWPKNLVELCSEADELKGKAIMTHESVVQQSPQMPIVDPAFLTSDCFLAYRVAVKLEKSLTIHMANGIVGDLEYDFYVVKEEIMRLLAMATLDISCIQLFILCLYHKFGLATKNTYSFLDPNFIQPKMMTIDERTRYITEAIQYGKKNCYLAPYVFNGHWMLLAICPHLNEIYWFDSIGGQPRDDIKNIIETSMKSLDMLGGKKPNRYNKLKWITCSCSIQPGSTECGYYVMKYMYEIISNQAYKGMDKVLERSGRLSYTIEEVDQIRDMWSKYLYEVWFASD